MISINSKNKIQALQFEIEPSDQGTRLDKFLAEKMPKYSRAMIQKIIKEKNILINAAETKSSYKIKKGDIIEVKSPVNKINPSPDSSIKITIIHEDKDFAIIDKPAGLVVYPGSKHEEKTLVNGLLAKWPEIKNVGEDPLRPGIVHRLDKDTSGIMIIAKNNITLEYFKNLFKNKKIEKTYTALVFGHVAKNAGKIDFPIRRSETNPIKQVAVQKKEEIGKSRAAVTYFKVLKYFSDKDENRYTLVEVKPKTGRMHQIRVHFAAIGHNIVGDKIYKYKKTPAIIPLKRHFLHATAIKFVSNTGREANFISPLSADLAFFLKTLKAD